MIKIKDCDAFIEDGLLQTSAKEWGETDVLMRDRLLKMSEATKIIEDERGVILMGGIVKPTLLSAPHLWLLLAERFATIKVSTMRALIELIRDAHGLETYIEEGNDKATNLALLFGFRPTDSQRVYGHILFRLWRRI